MSCVWSWCYMFGKGGRLDSRCAWHLQGRACSYMMELAMQDSINRLSDCYVCECETKHPQLSVDCVCMPVSQLSVSVSHLICFCFSFCLFLFLILSLSVSVCVSPSLSITVLLLFWIKEVRITFAQLSGQFEISQLELCWLSVLFCLQLVFVWSFSLATASGMITDETGLPDWTWIKWQWLIFSR